LRPFFYRFPDCGAGFFHQFQGGKLRPFIAGGLTEKLDAFDKHFELIDMAGETDMHIPAVSHGS
jgi:hypothetical protein